MVKIKITRGGCGIEYLDGHGSVRHMLKTDEDVPFMCDSEQAERLVRLDVAAYVTTKGSVQAKASEGDPEPEDTSDTRTGHLSAEDLGKWDFNDLRRLAADMGVKPNGNKKADYIAAIAAAEVMDGDNETEETEEDDELPELGTADPE